MLCLGKLKSFFDIYQTLSDTGVRVANRFSAIGCNHAHEVHLTTPSSMQYVRPQQRCRTLGRLPRL